MRCVVCGAELADGEAICTPCARSHIRDEWFSDREGYFRLRRRAELVSVLDDEQFRMTLGGESPDERISDLPETAEGYRTARRLMQEIIEEYSAGGNVEMPRYSLIARSLARLERYDELFPDERDVQFCNALAGLYSKALKNFMLPLAPADFVDERRRALQEKSDYWRRRGSNDTGGSDGGASMLKTADLPEHEYADAAAQPVTTETDTEVLRSRIKSIEEQIAGLRRIVPAAAVIEQQTDAISATAADRISELRGKIQQIEEKMQGLGAGTDGGKDVTSEEAPKTETPAEAKQDHTDEHDGLGMMKKRIAVNMLAGEYQDAFEESFELLRRGGREKDDFEIAALLALRMNYREGVKNIDGIAPGPDAAAAGHIAAALFAWRDGKWGSAIQLADDEIEQTGSSAAFLLKMNICRQYGLTDRADELGEQRKIIRDLAAGSELLSKMYLQLDMWGAALQCLDILPDKEWTDGMWYARALAMEQKGVADSAMDAYDRSLQINGFNSSAMVKKALLLSAGGRRTEASELLKSVSDLWPPVARLRADVLEAMGKTEEALELLKIAAREDSEDVKTVRAGISVAARLGRRKDRKYFTSLLRPESAVQ